MKAAMTGVAMVALIATGAVAAKQRGHSAAATKAAVAAALANPARADQAGDDIRREAAEVLAFSGVGPGDRVIDFIPGSGYWTRLFATAVGPTGKIFALWPAAAAKYAEKALPALQARKLANVTAELQTVPFPSVATPVDIFWTVQNYHDIPNDGGGEAALKAFNAAVFKALKPGGTYIIIDHADAPGSGMTGASTTHRIDPVAVKAQVIGAGFRFAGESRALRNPADDHKAKVFDPAIRGKTDQFVYKFRKPG